MPESAAQKLRSFADNIGSLDIPAPVRMMLGSKLDLEGAAEVMREAAAQLDRIDALEKRVEAIESGA